CQSSPWFESEASFERPRTRQGAKKFVERRSVSRFEAPTPSTYTVDTRPPLGRPTPGQALDRSLGGRT
ncbi:MAG: hypothetical protein R3324_07715, partial [Halobacteriales archaeon]|nr:hypothetical protein [Halobacteriales archaeon]